MCDAGTLTKLLVFNVSPPTKKDTMAHLIPCLTTVVRCSNALNNIHIPKCPLLAKTSSTSWTGCFLLSLEVEEGLI